MNKLVYFLAVGLAFTALQVGIAEAVDCPEGEVPYDTGCRPASSGDQQDNGGCPEGEVPYDTGCRPASSGDGGDCSSYPEGSGERDTCLAGIRNEQNRGGSCSDLEEGTQEYDNCRAQQ